jgi:hypothetical protein
MKNLGKFWRKVLFEMFTFIFTAALVVATIYLVRFIESKRAEEPIPTEQTERIL